MIMFSIEEYEKMLEMEDLIWVMRAKAAAQEGYLSPEESENFIKECLDEEES
ncbi:MAG: toxin-antitoxin system subunit antitoxin [Alphaproteobacteria bacterium]